MGHGPVKFSLIKMGAEVGHINFMFLAPPHPATGSATNSKSNIKNTYIDISPIVNQNNFIF